MRISNLGCRRQVKYSLSKHYLTFTPRYLVDMYTNSELEKRDLEYLKTLLNKDVRYSRRSWSVV